MILNRENVDQYSITSPYRVIISQFIIALCTLNGKDAVHKKIADAIMYLVEIAMFNPTKPVRDQGMNTTIHHEEGNHNYYNYI